jgi:mannan polymerase II complex MNN11 subunit
MNPELEVESHIMHPKQLESLMIKEHPVVPPDSVIKTFAHLKGSQVDFVLTQDKDGLSQGSFILRNGDWSRFFLDTWFDPLYRSYNFQKADSHALVGILHLPISFVTHRNIGTHCAMAPNNLVQIGSCSPTTNERVQ